jgi:hypothetical protein
MLAPINAERSSYSPLILLAVIVAIVLLTMQIVHRCYHGRVRTAPPWDCGFPAQTARMQDTAEGFGQPIRQVFETFFRIERHLPSPFDEKPSYAVKADDHFWYWLYLPIVRSADFLGRIVGKIQQGRISVYLRTFFVARLASLRAMTVSGFFRNFCTFASRSAGVGAVCSRFLGNQCRAWLQVKSAPSLLLPYRTIRLFLKDAVVATNASPFSADAGV